MDFFDVILLILLLLTFMLSFLFAGRHFIHMFQLNGYKPRVQVNWLKKICTAPRPSCCFLR